MRMNDCSQLAQLAQLAQKHNIPLGLDFHELDSSAVERILDAADEWGYRPPSVRNGSTARYFYAYMSRADQS